MSLNYEIHTVVDTLQSYDHVDTVAKHHIEAMMYDIEDHLSGEAFSIIDNALGIEFPSHDSLARVPLSSVIDAIEYENMRAIIRRKEWAAKTWARRDMLTDSIH